VAAEEINAVDSETDENRRSMDTAARNPPSVEPSARMMGVEAVMPRMADEFAFSRLTAAGYFIPAIVVLILGLDWIVFEVCIACEIVFFLWARVIQMWFMPGGVAAAVTTLLMLQPILIVSVVFLVIVLGILLAENIQTNGKLQEISLFSRMAAGAAVVSLAADAIHRFRRVTLRKIRFMQRMNDLYVFDGEPNRRLFSGRETIIENVLLALLGSTLAAVYFGLALAIAFIVSKVLGLFVAGERAWATGAVFGFAALRVAWDALRAYGARNTTRPTRTVQDVLDGIAAANGKRIVPRTAPRMPD